MQKTFTLAAYTDSVFLLEYSMWTGKTNLYQDDMMLEQVKPRNFIFRDRNDVPQTISIRTKTYDPVPFLLVNDKEINLFPALTWYQYALGAVPILLLFLGGAIGGAIGVGAVFVNYNIFRGDDSTTMKYAKVLAVILLSYVLVFLIAVLLRSLIN